MLFVVRPRAQPQNGVRATARDADEALRIAREMEERGLEVEIVDPSGQAHVPAELVVGDPAAAGLPPDQIALIQSTCDVLLAADTRAADIFYDRLFSFAPETRTMFEDDLGAQKRKLLNTLGSLVGYLAHPDLLGPAAAELGRRHVRYGVAPAHYGPAGQALLASLADLLGPRFTPEVKAAWAALYGQLSRSMIGATHRPDSTGPAA